MHTTDLDVIFNIFTWRENPVLVYDPNKHLIENSTHDFQVFDAIEPLQAACESEEAFDLINLSKTDLHPFIEKHGIDNILQLHQHPKDEDWHLKNFFFVNNPDGTIRWIFPSNLRYPSFLTLYNAAGIKALLIKIAFQIAFIFGLKTTVSSGRFVFLSKEKNRLDRLVGTTIAEGYSIFTGTVGDNRKAIIEVNRNRKTTHFIKIPLGEASEVLVEHEKSQLTSLEKLTLKKSIVPTVTAFENSNVAILSNIRPKRFSESLELRPLHLEVLREWYEKTTDVYDFEELAAYRKLKKNLKALATFPEPANDLDKAKTDALIRGLIKLEKNFKPKDEVATAITHCDFTPWNMYFARNRLHIYDWELSRGDLPLLFDAFHFIFQTNILIKRTEFPTIKQQINTLKNSKLANQLKGQRGFEFDRSYQFYLLFNISYYLILYLKQEPLHMQAHWLVNTWHDAIQDLV